MKKAEPSGLPIDSTYEIARQPKSEPTVARVATQLESGPTDFEIAVTTELAPAMVLALLATTAKTRATRDELEPALDALGAAVVRSSSEQKVRMQLLFDRGAVLPIELTVEAAEALQKGLAEYLASPQRRLAQRR